MRARGGSTPSCLPRRARARASATAARCSVSSVSPKPGRSRAGGWRAGRRHHARRKCLWGERTSGFAGFTGGGGGGGGAAVELASTRDEMWSEGRYDYERLPRERVPPRSHPSDEFGYRWTRDDHSTSRQSDYRDMRDGFRRKSFYSSHYSRDRSPHKRDAPFFRESPVGRKDSPHSRSGSSVSSRSYSPERSRTHTFHQSQHRKSSRVGASYKRQNEATRGRGKERSIQSLKTSRDTSPSSSSAVSSSKALDKPSRLTEKELAEAESKWAADTLERSDENNLGEISEFEAGSAAPLFIDQTEEPESNTTDGTEMYEDSQLSSRSKAIASKTKEIEQVYRQDCETFGMVVKMLIEKDPSLEKSIQFALRQNLHEIGERCVEELKHFITEYDNSTQDFGDPF
eukprot:XP_006242295.1 PREDICTED: periphilin-1 isoform X4 [Rattus norvegicus]